MNPTVYVNGTALDLDEVEYRISLTHGRNDITAAPAPSDASMTLYGFTSIPITISDVVEVEADRRVVAGSARRPVDAR